MHMAVVAAEVGVEIIWEKYTGDECAHEDSETAICLAAPAASRIDQG
jgi:hypothetical protein